jgi:hypothetical protein
MDLVYEERRDPISWSRRKTAALATWLLQAFQVLLVEVSR